MMLQPLTTLNLPEHRLRDLSNMGYGHCEEITNNFLPSSSSISSEEWKRLTCATKIVTALDILKEEDESSYIVTGCSTFDNIFEYGIPLNTITEICGTPGTGKTQLCLQLCASVQMPNCFGGLDSHAVYIDSTFGFTVQRLEEIAKGRLNQCCHLASKFNSFEMLENLQPLNESSILDRVHYIQISTFEEFVATLNLLRALLIQDPKIKLVIIDNITDPMKSSHYDLFKKVQILYSFLSDLQKLATEKKIAVVMTNDLTSKIDELEKIYLVPSLGDLYGHRIVNRILLERCGTQTFVAKIVKNVLKEYTEAKFQITNEGISDIE